ncbi:helix-turn-helix transcriptional regulator [Sneathiella limimaris]|uniref:helix-turn-helix transcriptional regulator n=1 Tax=Sneathiella limimaris TaxID=1964213 RepID=UPI00146A2721|nr:helix-turn-helix transcriptional regulator [Sneathiella limimaris]
MSRQPKMPDSGFSNTQLVTLIWTVFKDRDKGLIPEGFIPPNPYASGVFDAAAKTKLVKHAFEVGGAAPILSVGQHLNKIGDAPIGRILLKSADPNVLAQKWMRLERYNHASHRLKITSLEDNSWSCKRFWKGAVAPSTAENILICGLLCGLLDLIGMKGIRVEMDGVTFSWPLSEKTNVKLSGEGRDWMVRWQKPSEKELPVSPNDTEETMVKRLSGLLSEDVARLWKLEEAAKSLFVSPRTLQRQIKSEGHSFSSLTRKVRITEACDLLLEGTESLSEIGYACGYSDQAHFQRDFRRTLNMTPGEYRSADRA